MQIMNGYDDTVTVHPAPPPPHNTTGVQKNTHMIHFIHHRVVRILVNRCVRAGLALALAVSCVWRAACIGRDFCARGAEGCRVVLYFFKEVGFGFEVVWWGRKWE